MGQWVTTVSLTKRVYLHSFRLSSYACQICEILQNSLKIQTYSSSRSSKVINLGANRKLMYNFLY